MLMRHRVITHTHTHARQPAEVFACAHASHTHRSYAAVSQALLNWLMCSRCALTHCVRHGAMYYLCVLMASAMHDDNNNADTTCERNLSCNRKHLTAVSTACAAPVFEYRDARARVL